jgi:Putative endonuclease segE, GIY-YIG domain
MIDLGHWTLEESVSIDENTFGFIYEITNSVTGMKYIGKKQCQSRIKRKPLKGKKRNRIDYVESDWRTYTSSSNELNEEIKKYGKEKFAFKIIRSCDSKWALAYYEIKEQIDRDVLFRSDYYNGIINCRIGKAPKEELKKFKDKGVII